MNNNVIGRDFLKLYRILSAAVIICLFTVMSATATDLSAESAVLIDAASGRVLLEKNAYERRGMASTTKIMTAIVALERGNLSDTVTVDKRAEGIEGSSLYLKAGDKISLKNLLYGMLLRSGNDGAAAVALHISPSIEEFASLMTQKAKDLGLKDTAFKNPHGLYEEGHYTTAYDLAQIARYGFTLDGFADMVGSTSYKIDDNIETKLVTNNNKLLRFYEGADGVKTGYTPETGRTLVGSATRNGMRVITVTLFDRDDWNDHMAMFDYAFDNYELKNLAAKGQGFGCVRVYGGNEPDVPAVAEENLSAAVKKGSTVKVVCKTDENLTAPVKAGQKIGSVTFAEGDEIIGETSLVAASGADKAKSPNLFWRIVNFFRKR